MANYCLLVLDCGETALEFTEIVSLTETVMFGTIEEQQLTSLSLTHVYYDPNHVLGLPSALLALVPQALIVFYVAVISCRRDVEVCHAFLGQLSCEALNWVLKRVIKQDRPQRIMQLGKGYGMPSSHSQFMGFFAIYTVLYLRHRCSRKHFFWHCGRALAIVAGSIGVCVSRIYLAYHTVEQVVVGASIGIIFGAVWFLVYTQLQQLGLIDWFLDLKVSQYFWLKDTILDEALEQEWLYWRRSRKTHNKTA